VECAISSLDGGLGVFDFKIKEKKGKRTGNNNKG